MEDIQGDKIEIEARTVEEAIRKAISVLKVSKKELKIKVLSEEKRGLFGMDGSKPARIMASVIQSSQKKKT